MKIFIYEQNKYWHPIIDDEDISYKNGTLVYKGSSEIKSLELTSRLKLEALDEEGDYSKFILTVIPSDFVSEFEVEDPFLIFTPMSGMQPRE